MENIHPTAIIDKNSKIGNNCRIGAFSIIGPNVELGDNNHLASNVLIEGPTKIGDNNKFFHSAVIGTDCQDLKYKGEPTELVIGSNNTFREFCTVNRSATLEEKTRIGNDNLLMAYSHVAHNCQLGNHLIIANAVNLAGHIHIDDNVTIGGMVAIHQFVRVGKFAFIGGKSGVKKDVPPFTRGEGFPYKIIGLNSIGLRRNGFSSQQIKNIKSIYKIFYHSGLNFSEALKEARKITKLSDEQKTFIEFIENTDRGLNR